MEVKFEEIDLGWKAYLKELKKLEDNPFVKVGIQQDASHPDDGESLLVIASSNEFGTNNGHIPERSYMRSTFDEQKKATDAFILKGYDNIMKQKTTVERVLGQLGAFFKGQVQKKMADLTTPPNAESTIKAKGSSNPLINTGFLRQSIKEKVILKGDK